MCIRDSSRGEGTAPAGAVELNSAAQQPDEAKRLAQEKARRDYFEEFFKNKQE